MHRVSGPPALLLFSSTANRSVCTGAESVTQFGPLAPFDHGQPAAPPLCHKLAASVLVRLHFPTQAVVDSGALEALTTCLEEFDPQVKESAAWAIGKRPRLVRASPPQYPQVYNPCFGYSPRKPENATAC